MLSKSESFQPYTIECWIENQNKRREKTTTYWDGIVIHRLNFYEHPDNSPITCHMVFSESTASNTLHKCLKWKLFRPSRYNHTNAIDTCTANNITWHQPLFQIPNYSAMLSGLRFLHSLSLTIYITEFCLPKANATYSITKQKETTSEVFRDVQNNLIFVSVF